MLKSCDVIFLCIFAEEGGIARLKLLSKKNSQSPLSRKRSPPAKKNKQPPKIKLRGEARKQDVEYQRGKFFRDNLHKLSDVDQKVFPELLKATALEVQELVYARGMRIARGDNGLDESLLDMQGPVAVAGPDESIPYEHGYPLPAGGFYMDAFDIRSVDGRSFGAAGPSAAWFRLLAPVFAGEPITPLDRVLAVADFGNGISNIIEMGRHLYINPDLTVNVHRVPRGEWLLSDAVTHLRADGYGTATATLADADGLLGIANQSLLVVPAS